MKIIEMIIGKRVSADYPINKSNPDETFVVTDIDQEVHGEEIYTYVKGEKTIWFNEEIIELVEEPISSVEDEND